jgi:hypothetical protein
LAEAGAGAGAGKSNELAGARSEGLRDVGRGRAGKRKGLRLNQIICQGQKTRGAEGIGQRHINPPPPQKKKEETKI